MRVSAKADYAVRAAVELAVSPQGEPVNGDTIAAAQDIPIRFLESILSEMRKQGLVRSRRGDDGGYWLAKPAGEITIGEVIRSVEGPLASVRGDPPDELAYLGAAEPLQGVWVALRANIRSVLDRVTLGDVVGGALPEPVRALAEHPESAPER